MKILCLTAAVLFAVVACESQSVLEIEKPDPPDVRFRSALVDYRKTGTVVETVLKNDGGSGVFKLGFWSKDYDGTPQIARETEPRVISWNEEVEYHWAITRDGSHIAIDSVQAWSTFTPNATWVLSDTFIFD